MDTQGKALNRSHKIYFAVLGAAFIVMVLVSIMVGR